MCVLWCLFDEFVVCMYWLAAVETNNALSPQPLQFTLTHPLHRYLKSLSSSNNSNSCCCCCLQLKKQFESKNSKLIIIKFRALGARAQPAAFFSLLASWSLRCDSLFCSVSLIDELID